MAKIVEVLLKLKTFLSEESTSKKYREKKCDFSRSGKIGFENAALLIASQMRGSLDVHLYKTLNINNLDLITKSAYSQSRYKIKSDLFEDVNDVLLKNVYKERGENLEEEGLKQYKSYYVEAIDGSKITLPNTQVMKDHFGSQIGGSKKSKTETAMCLLMCRYDVLNHYYTKAEVAHLKVGENTVLKSWVHDLKSDAITLFDRGFASFYLFSVLNKYKKPYVMRVKLGFNKEVSAFLASGKTEEVVIMTASKSEEFEGEKITKGDTVRVRLIRVVLSTGEVEILATNLMDEVLFKALDFKELYGFRWGIETSYDTIKNKFLILCFSGQKPESIYQDIYATIFVHNLYTLISNESQVIVNEKFKHRKYNYSINKNVTIAMFKEKIMSIFLAL
jgi:Transposase DDE domain